MKKTYVLTILLIFSYFNGILAVEDDWYPVLRPESLDGIKSLPIIPASRPSFGGGGGGGGGGGSGNYDFSIIHGNSNVGNSGSDQCEIYKVGFIQDLYFQYIQYKTHIPEMKEFTLCFWSKFYNHSNDHPVFSYAVDGQPKAISAWISNTERSSYFSLAVEGQTMFRLNYPLRLNKWYHTCESWNGKTGEWQIWVNAERVGRGFHNRLVGFVIPSGGIAITGQEQTQLGGGFYEGKGAPKGSGGMLGEITMLQLYNVALTAGKAHRDHKHHHAHQYDHNGNQITTTPSPTLAPPNILPSHPLLTGGQINPMLRLNFAGGQPPAQPQIVQGQEFNAQYLNGQFVGNLVTQQLTRQQQQQQQQSILSGDQSNILGIGNPILSLPPRQPQSGSGLVHQSLVNPANVQFIDRPLEPHQLFKRGNEKIEEETAKFGDKISKKIKRQSKDNLEGDTVIKQKKREIFLNGGTIIDDGVASRVTLDQSLLFGLAGIGDNQPILEQQKQNDEREPAEAEVQAVMNICSNCDPEPFGKALVFGWRSVPKKLYSGAFYQPATPRCKAF